MLLYLDLEVSSKNISAKLSNYQLNIHSEVSYTDIVSNSLKTRTKSHESVYHFKNT